MGFRITTNMMMNTYRYNLQGSTKKLSDARDMVLTQRNFNSYADDPAAATLAFRLRREYYQTTNYLNNTTDTYSKFNTAWQNLSGVVEDLSDATARVASIRGNNGTAGESRTALAVVLRETSESVVHALNQKVGDHFVFAGNDGLNVPFSWEDGKLLYRGIDVNSGSMEKPTEAAKPTWLEEVKDSVDDWTKNDAAWYAYYSGATKEMPEVSTKPQWVKELMDKAIDAKANGGEDEKAWADYYIDRDNVVKLTEMADEEMYIDLGMGAEESSPNNPVRGSYFNSALSGVDYIGYGVDEDGDPLNLSLIMRELADVFDNWHENGQKYVPDEYKDMSYSDFQARMESDPKFAAEINAFHDEYEAKAFRLMDKLKAAQEHTTEKWVELDANSVFLQTTESRLKTQSTDINTQVLDIEQVDLADAITSFSWQQYCYNAALKIGNQLLSQSLIDYMN